MLLQNFIRRRLTKFCSALVRVKYSRSPLLHSRRQARSLWLEIRPSKRSWRMRCGYCVARPELIRLMRSQQTWDSVNIMALVAASASLQDTAQVEQGRRRNSEVKKFVYSELDKLGFNYIPSQANFMMIDLRR